MFYAIIVLICITNILYVIIMIYTKNLLVIDFFINCTILHPINVVILITMTLSTRKTWS